MSSSARRSSSRSSAAAAAAGSRGISATASAGFGSRNLLLRPQQLVWNLESPLLAFLFPFLYLLSLSRSRRRKTRLNRRIRYPPLRSFLLIVFTLILTLRIPWPDLRPSTLLRRGMKSSETCTSK